MTQYSFFKMHGIGNDYIFIDCRYHEFPPIKEVAKTWCDRNRGIGSDGIVLILLSSEATVKMRICNTDGSEAQTCGNALRCIGKYLDDRNELSDGSFTIETIRRIVHGVIIKKGTEESIVAVNMGLPVWNPREIPVSGYNDPVIQQEFIVDKD